MNYQEIINKISEKLSIKEFALWEVDENDLEETANETYDEAYNRKINYLTELKDSLGEIKTLEGVVHDGESFRIVKHIVDHDIYVLIGGYYSSYVGHQFDNGWNNCVEVFPREKVIIVYEEKETN